MEHKLRYDEYGKGKNNHILFIHGLGSSSIIWRDIPEALSEYFHTITIDLIGFGRSDKPQTNYTIHYFSQIIEKFVEKIGIVPNDKLIIIGHSLGGYIALEYAIKKTSKIAKLILIDSSGLLDHPTPLLIQYLQAALTTEHDLRYIRLKEVFENLVSNPTMLLPVTIDLFISVIEQPNARHAFESAYNNSTSRIIETKSLEKIKDIPCLIIWGEKDKLIPIKFAYKFKEIISKSCLVVIKDAGHSPFYEKTAIVYQHFLNFLLNDRKK